MIEYFPRKKKINEKWKMQKGAVKTKQFDIY